MEQTRAPIYRAGPGLQGRRAGLYPPHNQLEKLKGTQMVVRRHPTPRARLAFAVTLALSGSIAHGAEENLAAALEAPTAEIIGTTPLPGIGVPVN
jgi:hypothetical protein